MADVLDDALAGLRDGGALEAQRLHAALQQRMFGGPARAVRLGRFTIRERIGQGAMGEVYAAHDPELDRRVALKLLHPSAAEDGTPTEPAHQRLRREAQAMARLTHPNVVTVHEVGDFEGRVYVVMELVDGVDLRRWLESPRPWRAIVEVFMAAGRGLAAAHDAGIVHRDFKPHNVLVGDDGRVRVADFGLAGLDAEGPRGSVDVTPSQTLTLTGAVLGTPAYMAPEQRRGEADARSDQYAFCVALFEALHGHRPGQHPREVEGRGRIPARVDVLLQRGLHEDPDERYPSMDALLLALSRATGGRWRGSALVGAAGLLVIVAAVGSPSESSSPLQACRAHAERWTESWTPARRQSLADRLNDDTPARAEEAMQTAVAAIEDYGEGWRAELDAACVATHTEGVQSSAQLGRRLDCLDERLSALAVLLDVLAEPRGDPGARAALAIGGLATPRSCRGEVEGEPPPAEAERLRRAHALVAAGRSVEAVTLLEAPPPEPLDPLTTARLHHTRARALRDADQLDAAREQLVAAIAAAEAADARQLRARTTIALADLVGHAHAEPKVGLEWTTLAEAIVDQLDEPRELRARLHRARGNIRFTQGRYAQAQAEHERSLALRLDAPRHREVEVGIQRMTLANTLLAQGRTDQARDQLEQALAAYERRLGASHPRVGRSYVNLSNVALAQGRLDEAADLARRALEIFGKSRPEGHADRALAHNALGTALASAGDLAGSIEPFEHAVKGWSASLGPQHPRVGNGRGNLALAYFGLERYDRALAHGRAALAIQIETQGPDHPDVALIHATVGRTRLARGELDEAVEQLARARAITEDALGADHAQLGPILLDLGSAHLARNDQTAAIEALRRASTIFEDTGATPVQRGGCAFRLGKALWQHGQGDEALAQLRAAREFYAAAAPIWQETHRETVDRWAADHGVPLGPAPEKKNDR